MMYGHWRPDNYREWFSFSTTVDWAKQFLSSTSTIIVVCSFCRNCIYYEASLGKLWRSFRTKEIFQRLVSSATGCYLTTVKRQGRNTAPFGASNNTKQALRPITSISKCNHNLSDSSCALACPVPTQSGSFGPGLIFLVLFGSSQKVQDTLANLYSSRA